MGGDSRKIGAWLAGTAAGSAAAYLIATAPLGHPPAYPYWIFLSALLAGGSLYLVPASRARRPHRLKAGSPGLHGRARETPPHSENPEALAGPPQKVIGDIPIEAQNLVPRQSILDQLAEAAAQGGSPARCAVIGLRGAGKTQAAAAYARSRVATDCSLVGWVNAETADSLRASLAWIARELGLADPDGDSLRSALRLKDHLQSRPEPGLLVFDNAADPDALRPFLPATGGTQVVITSTRQAFAQFGRPIKVTEFSRAESLEFLRESSGLADTAGAADVAGELGDLPLALAQATAAMRSEDLTYEAYLARLRKVPVEALLGPVQGDGYSYSTAAALLLSIQAAEATDRTGLVRWLLRTIAALSPDGVERALLDRIGALRSLGADTPAIDAAIGRCVAASLLTRSESGEALIMHRLLGRVLRERDQAAGQWPDTVSTTLGLLEPLPEDHPWSQRKRGESLVRQIEALWEASSQADPAAPPFARRMLLARSWAVRQFLAAADLNRAVDLGARVLGDWERVQGPDDPGTLASRENLAFAYWKIGRLDQATLLYEQILANRRQLLGADHRDSLGSANNLATAYLSADRLEDAIRLYEETLTACTRILGPEDADTLGSADNLASAYVSAGQADQAISLHQQTLASRTRIPGPADPGTMNSRNSLAYALKSAGRIDDAIQLYETNLAACEEHLGADHPQTLMSRNNLICAYEAAGHLGKAIPLYEASLAACEEHLGADHPQTLTSRNNLACAYQSAGRLDQAITLHQRNLADYERVLGEDHADTMISRNNLASACWSAGLHQQAVTLYQQALNTSQRTLGPDHPRTLTAQANLHGAQSTTTTRFRRLRRHHRRPAANVTNSDL